MRETLSLQVCLIGENEEAAPDALCGLPPVVYRERKEAENSTLDMST
jgi:hypothetical protein